MREPKEGTVLNDFVIPPINLMEMGFQELELKRGR
jgi:hypothetical protein